MNSILSALALGAIYGLVVYGVYDMTNMATLQDYGLKVAVMDMAWGTVLNAVGTLLLYFLREKIA